MAEIRKNKLQNVFLYIFFDENHRSSIFFITFDGVIINLM